MQACSFSTIQTLFSLGSVFSSFGQEETGWDPGLLSLLNVIRCGNRNFKLLENVLRRYLKCTWQLFCSSESSFSLSFVQKQCGTHSDTKQKSEYFSQFK